MYLLIKYIKSVLWGVAKRLSYIEDARCVKVNVKTKDVHAGLPFVRNIVCIHRWSTKVSKNLTALDISLTVLRCYK